MDNNKDDAQALKLWEQWAARNGLRLSDVDVGLDSSTGELRELFLEAYSTGLAAHIAGTSQVTKAQADNKLKSNPVDAQKTEDLAIKAQAEPEEWRTFLQMWTHDGALQTFSNRQKFRNAAFALLAAPVAKESPAVLEGWKLVPVEPTDEMRTACKVLNYADDIDAEWARLLAAAPQAPVAMAEPEAPAILGAISYHARERDDLTLEEAVEAFRHGYKKVRQRDDRAMLLQLIHLMASVPVAATKEAESVQAALEQIAQSWDGCMVDAPGGEMDVAATLRSQFKGIETGVQANVLPPFAAPASQQEAGWLGKISAGEYDRENGTMYITLKLPMEGLPTELLTIGGAAVIAPASEPGTAGSAQGGNTNTESSDLAPTTSTVSAPDDDHPHKERAAAMTAPELVERLRLDAAGGMACDVFMLDRAADLLEAGTQAAPEEVLDKAVAECRKIVAKYVDKASEGKINSIRRNRNNWKVDAARECCDAINALRTTSTDQANADTGSAE